MKKAVVIFSGGQDSTTCLKWALNRFDVVHAITFAYGQKHSVEIDQSKIICEHFGVTQSIIDITFLDQICESALLNKDLDVNDIIESGLPASFVPNRNQIFITLAHSYAQKVGASALVTGVCQEDYSGYPDCRRSFIDKIEAATNSGSGLVDEMKKISIVTPLMYIDKAKTFLMAVQENCYEEVINMSHTCYNGDRSNLHDWGYGCGICPACKLREKGFEQYKELISIKY